MSIFDFPRLYLQCMARKKIIVIMAALAFLTAVHPCVAQQTNNSMLEGFEFVDREYTELFYMLSLYSGISISADDTVSGRATFRCTGQDFEQAFDLFLRSQRLYVIKSDSVWTVTRLLFSQPQKDSSLWQMDASDMTPSRIVEKIAVFFGCEISYDTLPDTPVSIHAEGNSACQFVASLVRQLGNGYSLSEDSGFLRIVKEVQVTPSLRTAVNTSSRTCSITGSAYSDSFCVNAQNVTVSELLEKLFALTGFQFVFSSVAQNQIQHIVCKDVSFAYLMNLLQEEYAVQDVVVNDVHYIVSAGQWKQYELSFISSEKCISLLNIRFGKTDTVLLSGTKCFLCKASDSVHEQIDSFIKLCDVSPSFYTVQLQYITVKDLLQHLPPAISANAITQTTQDTQFFFSGSDAEYELLCSLLETLDTPVKRVRYDVLIIQYQNTDDFSWEQSLSANRLKLGDKTDVSALLSSVLSLNLNVVSAFGLDFAASLQSALNKNYASVFADTTLYGVSGSSISFRNTNTYRYRDNNIDPATGKPVYTGVTREIVSGLTLEITGWVSGDGMITSDIKASVSRQGADLSKKTGNPPPTSEKLVTTQVRAKSGEPIILTGLVQDETSSSEQGVPFLSQIPGLGMLFKSLSSSKARTEMVIYLVPHWEKDPDADSVSDEKTWTVSRVIKELIPEVCDEN